jgi:hypothetical protein
MVLLVPYIQSLLLLSSRSLTQVAVGSGIAAGLFSVFSVAFPHIFGDDISMYFPGHRTFLRRPLR